MSNSVEVKSARIDALLLRPESADLAVIEDFLQNRAAQYCELSLPFIIDCKAFASPEDINLEGLLGILKSQGLRVVGLRHENRSVWQSAAEAVGLLLQTADKGGGSAKLTDSKPAAKPTVLVSSPVRTGQQVYAEGADLIVTGAVSEGAEIIADGNIHVYAPMRGRALAGADGRTDARIFIHSMQAELVSVAGIYRNFEQDLPDHLNRRPVQIYLHEGRLVVSAIQ
ncbi:MAG: septum site-determining protein MinC [Neisseria sp.]|nr:septum site-determining protein MinC [Neisseria sp.]